MTIDNTSPKKVHQGHNIKRFREILGVKQDALAYELNVSQAAISKLENKEEIEEPTLQQIAEILKVPVEAIKNFDEEQAVSIFSNTVNNNDNATGNSLYNYCPIFNPIDKVMELFERLLESEKEKTQLIKDILDRMK